MLVDGYKIKLHSKRLCIETFMVQFNIFDGLSHLCEIGPRGYSLYNGHCHRIICQICDSMSGLFHNRSLDCVYNVAHMFIGDIWSCGKTDANLEERLADTIDICRCIAIDRLLVHRLP